MKNIVSVLAHLISDLNIPVSKESIEDELYKHPSAYSLLGLSDVLNNFRVSNDAYQVDFAELTEVPCPFISYVSNKEFLLVHNIHNDYFTVSNERWSKHHLSAENFKNIYSGSVLTAEKNNNSGEDKFYIKRRKELFKSLRLPMCLASVCLITVLILVIESKFISTLTLPMLILTLVKTTGLFTSVLLLIQGIDVNNPLIQRICGGNSKYNCNAILSSKAAKVFEWLSWSEVGFFYFSATWLLLIFSGYSINIMHILFILNIVSLPYTFYSIYYQATVAKNWCMLCCTIQGLLWVEFIFIVKYAGGTNSLFSSGNNNNVKILSELFICLAAPIVVWMLLKPLLLNNQKLLTFKEELRQFKYNDGLFKGLLNLQPKYVQPDKSWCIVLGDVTTKNCITMVSDPYCFACIETHQLLNELLSENPNIHARIVFTATNNKGDIKTAVCRHLIAINDSTDKQILSQALHDWYTQKHKNYDSWAKNYPVDIDESVLIKIDNQHHWCQIVQVTGTPTLLVNGYRLPEVYRLPDLKYMLN